MEGETMGENLGWLDDRDKMMFPDGRKARRPLPSTESVDTQVESDKEKETKDIGREAEAETEKN